MKSVLISIQPTWCELIASGKKTIEVRKTRPKLETPFKCYIYCTLSGSNEFFRETLRGDFARWNRESWGLRKGKVIGEFVCDKIEYFAVDYRGNGGQNKRISELSCVSIPDLIQYQGGAYCLYGWHISEPVIYDKPKELSDFVVEDTAAIKRCKHRFRTGQPEYVTQHGGWIKGSYGCVKIGGPAWCEKCITKPLIRPPQSWCYVEELV